MAHEDVTEQEIVGAIQVLMKVRVKELKLLSEFEGNEDEEAALFADVQERREVLKAAARVLQGCLDEMS